MKANKPLKEAILRAPESTDENKQPQQEQLFNLAKSSDQSGSSSQKENIINESARNRIVSLQNLRELEYNVEKQVKKDK